MNLNESLALIKSFYKEETTFGETTDTTVSRALEDEKRIKFPPEFKEYIDNFMPSSGFSFGCVGNPLDIYDREQLSWLMKGYNFNPVLNKPINDWDDSWFIFADEGADPVIIKLDEMQSNSVVYQAIHGCGNWEFEPIADSIGQFLVCCAAIDHALSWFESADDDDVDYEEAIIDDEKGFNLADEPAQWLFPFIKKYAPNYYDYWLAAFDNR